MAIQKRLDILVNAKNRTGKAFGGVTRGLRSLTRSLTSIPRLVAGALGGVAIGAFVRSSIKAFGAQEKAVENLRQALIDSGDAGARSLKGLQAYASALQEVTTQGDEATLQLAAYISGIGNLSGQALQDATTATLGLARATGQGSEIMGRAMLNAIQGNFSMLERYIPALRAAETETEKMALVQELASKGLRQMESDAGTTLGGFQQLSNAFGDMQEELAGSLEPALRSMSATLLEAIPVVRGYALDFVGGMRSIVDASGTASQQVGLDTAAMTAVFKNFGLSVQIVGLTIADSFLGAFDTIRNTFQNVGEFIGVGVVNFASLALTSFENIGIMFKNLFTGFVPIMSEFVDIVAKVADNILTIFKNLGKNIFTVFKASFASVTSLSLEPFRKAAFTGLTEGFEDLTGNIDKILINLTEGTTSSTDAPFVPFKAIPKTASDAARAVAAQLAFARRELELEINGERGSSGKSRSGGGVKDPSFAAIASVITAGGTGAETKEAAIGRSGSSRSGLAAIEVSSRLRGINSALRGGDDPQKKIVENTKKTAEDTKKTVNLLQAIADGIQRGQQQAGRLIKVG